MDYLQLGYFVLIIISILTFLYILFLFVKLKYLLRNNEYSIVKLKGFKSFSIIYFVVGILGVLLLFVVPVEFSWSDYDWVYFLVFGVSLILRSFISPQNFVLLNQIGIKEEANGKLVNWDKVTKVELNQRNDFRLYLYTSEKEYIFFDCGNQSYLDSILDKIKTVRPDIFNKFFYGI